MKYIYLSFLGLLAAFFFSCSQNPSTQAIQDLIARVSDSTANSRIETKISSQKNGDDYFKISHDGNKLLLEGNSTVSLATGFNWYLKYVAGTNISWNNLNEKLPANLPLPDSTIYHSTNQHIRYYLNYCTFSYSMAFWDWHRWEQELDWMALHGVNVCLDMVGNDVVWYNVLKKLGYSDRAINRFVAGPAYQAWWQMNNLEGWGGPNTPQWYERQEQLQKKIVARMHELGIEPVFPGYSGMVPSDIGDKLGYKIFDPGKWCSYSRPAFLDPTDTHFKDMAHLYYSVMDSLYGKANYYSMDPFHEGGNTQGYDLVKAGKRIMSAMRANNSKAVWVIQAWQANPRKELLKTLPKHKLLVLDLNVDHRPQWGDPVSEWYRPEGFMKHDWVYCMLLNFGGRVGLHGRMQRVIDSYYLAKSSAHGKTMTGVGVTAEAIENNPVMYELLYELPWRNHKFTKESWLNSYITARYGKSNEYLSEAWRILSNTSYACPNDYPGQGTIESLFCARPSTNPDRASTWGSSKMYYDPDMTRTAADLFIKAIPEFKGNNNFEYDLADILRQSIADKANTIMKSITVAYRTKNIRSFKTNSDKFLHLILQQDSLLASRPEFCVGNWISQALHIATNHDDSVRYEWNARKLITVWGNQSASDTGMLHDYSSREWNGILKDLYYPRWKLFFATKLDELQRGVKPGTLDFYIMENTWSMSRNAYPVDHTLLPSDRAADIYQSVFEN